MSKNAINERFINSVNQVISGNKLENKSTIATKLQIKKAKFSEILNSRMNVGIEEIILFCEEYNYNVEWLVTGKGKIKRNEDQQIEIPLLRVEEPQEEIYEKSNVIELLREQNSILTKNAEMYKERAEMYKEKYENCENEKKPKRDFK